MTGAKYKMKKNKKPVASVSSGSDIIVGSSDSIHWNDVMSVNGYDIKVSKAVELGLEYKLEIAEKLQCDLK